ncbi:MAG: hypothetical protein KGL39_33205 [Patescibacteria group bacterium]|nr:hypothetical protein [Patescibacteria group bacterium]
MSLYSEYKLEREGKLTLELENVLVIYKAESPVLYIEDVFVRESARAKGLDKRVILDLAETYKQKGFSKIATSVAIATARSTENLARNLRLGFKLSHADGQLIYLIREIP